MKLQRGAGLERHGGKAWKEGAAGSGTGTGELALRDKLRGSRWGPTGAPARSGPGEVQGRVGGGMGEDTPGARAGSSVRVIWLSREEISGAGRRLGLPRTPLMGPPGA